ncbi:hypothetical protein D1114_01825 [Cereibacter sphaeroides]|uniref:Uncharacterized protein n=2 Tax=Cereibacter sphaeroides TaxID=1063 RepID=A0AAX1USD1_CERSP|nr:hypothetical protein D1114_01825 [Cereibacter sphaeroides]
MAVAAGITARSFGVLIENSLAPDTVEYAIGKQAARYWNSFGLGEAALIGAIHKSGAELLMSAKIAHLVIDEFVGPRGHLPSRLGDYLNRPLNPNPGRYPWAEDDPQDWLRIRDDFWLHHILRTRTDIYNIGKAMDGDLVMEIADRRYVFTDFAWSPERKLPRANPWGTTSASDPDWSLEIEGWERGKDAVVRPVHELIDISAMMDDPAAKEAARQREKQTLDARRNAVGLLRVNVSLAIRNAFDAVHEHRLASGSSFDWSAHSQPKPSRYSGSDANGDPLDINHHWYADLSPAERAKRRDEIEEYIAKRDMNDDEPGA